MTTIMDHCKVRGKIFFEYKPSDNILIGHKKQTTELNMVMNYIYVINLATKMYTIN